MATRDWKGHLNFSLICVPVRMSAAARGERISINQLHQVCHSRLKQQLFCQVCNRNVERSKKIKGYEHEKDQYVLFSEEELDKIEPPSANVMEILEFVKTEEVDPVYYESSYYMAPDAAGEKPMEGSRIVLSGEYQKMQQTFRFQAMGMVGAVVLIYFLIVVNFQSWSDPFVIITALPAALAGIVWMLFTTQTTLSVPALTGAIMCMGVATANSILLVTFANGRFEAGQSAFDSAIEAGTTRLRPILMTAFAMIIGMVPMALGLGEGGEQNAPLARAVIGGLTCATIATLFFVPLMFSVLRNRTVRNQEPA